MCGRFALYSSLKEIEREFNIKVPFEIKPNYNIAPSQDILAITKEKAEKFRWGLIPSWAKDENYKMINARAETFAEKPSFKKAKRCLIVADGFFEWKKIGNVKKPMFIHLKTNRPFSFAGLCDVWKSIGKEIRSCTIITTEPNELIKPIHNRMPAIIPKQNRDDWLENKEIELKPYQAEGMEAYQISSIVNSLANNSEECVKPKEI